MRLLILFLLVISLSRGDVAIVKKPYYFPPQMADLMINRLLQCISEAGYDNGIFQKLKQGQYEQDIRVVEIILCANVKLGTAYANGRANVENMTRDLFPDMPETRAVLVECDVDRHVNPAETFKEFLLCFRDRVPYKIRL